jgi:hypothetical protein
MMELTVPKNQISSYSKLFYVSSETSPEDKHIVVRLGSKLKPWSFVYYCDCKDFMVRKLRTVGTSFYEPCKHGKFVRDVESTLPGNVEVVRAVRKTIKTVPAVY